MTFPDGTPKRARDLMAAGLDAAIEKREDAVGVWEKYGDA